MLDLHSLRADLDTAVAGLQARGVTGALDDFRRLDETRRRLISESEVEKHRKNRASEEIGGLMKNGRTAEAEARRGEVRDLTTKIGDYERELAAVELSIGVLLQGLPNLPHASVPVGRSSDQNVVVRTWGETKDLGFEAKDHAALGESLGILDFERAAKISGARFATLCGAGARLERALMNFMLDLHTREFGYLEVLPPFLVTEKTLFGTGQLPKFAGDLFHVKDFDLHLIPTAEVPLTNLHAGEILDAAALPIRMTAWTPCFRSEAGSYGKDVRGLIRLHQFNKVELVSLTTFEASYDELERMTACAEEVLRRLGLPYRVVSLCTGDLGFAAAKTYDLEVWLPSQKAYREISSCSNCEGFQARRAGIRYRPMAKSKPEFVHTLNGSGLAVGRTLLAILENGQRKDGSVTIPEALRPWMGGLETIGREGA